MTPVRKAVLQSVFRWMTVTGGSSTGIAGANVAGVPVDALGALSPWIPVVLGITTSLAGLGLSILDKIPDAEPPKAG